MPATNRRGAAYAFRGLALDQPAQRDLEEAIEFYGGSLLGSAVLRRALAVLRAHLSEIEARPELILLEHARAQAFRRYRPAVASKISHACLRKGVRPDHPKDAPAVSRPRAPLSQAEIEEMADRLTKALLGQLSQEPSHDSRTDNPGGDRPALDSEDPQ